MKSIFLFLFCILTNATLKNDPMIALLKQHLQDKNEAEIILLIQKKPNILELKDDSGTTGLLLIAYSGLEDVFEKAIALKKSFSFHEAIVCGKIEIVEDLLKQESSNLSNSYSNDGFSALALASFFNRTSIAKLLVSKGANPNLAATNPSKVNALHAAIAKENYELCKLFLEVGVKVDTAQTQGVTALHSAVHRGNLALVKLLIEYGASITVQMTNEDTPLLIAKREDHKTIEAYLLEQLN